MICMEAATA